MKRNGAIAIVATTAVLSIWLLKGEKPKKKDYYNELRRVPKPGCHQRWKMHEHSQRVKSEKEKT